MRKHIMHSAAAAGFALVVAACGRESTEASKAIATSLPSTDAAAVGAAAAAAPPPAVAPAPVESPEARDEGASLASTRSNVALGSPLPPSTDQTGAMLVRQGEASIEVRQVEDAVARLRQTAAQFGGFVANTTLRTGREEKRGATLELRVPTAQFEPLLGALSSLGKVESVSAGAQDVGEEYVDIGARAANARRLEARLVEMLATRTGRLSEVLTVERELTRVREEIERYEARLRFLERRTALSTLSVSLHEPLGLIDDPRPGPLAEALRTAWQRAMGVVAWCIALLGLLVPVAVLAGLAVLLVRRARVPRAQPE